MILDDDAPAGIPPRRAASRRRVQVDIYLRKHAFGKSRVALLDLSRTGCKVELIYGVTKDETVWVTLPGLQSIEARVAWMTRLEAGLKFVTPIHPAVCQMLLGKLAK